MARKGVARCGHPGTYFSPTFITCDLRCEFAPTDGVPVELAEIDTKPLCRHCGSDDLEAYNGFVDEDGKTAWHCHNCQYASLI